MSKARALLRDRLADLDLVMAGGTPLSPAELDGLCDEVGSWLEGLIGDEGVEREVDALGSLPWWSGRSLATLAALVRR